jgi:hypothetical protein
MLTAEFHLPWGFNSGANRGKDVTHVIDHLFAEDCAAILEIRLTSGRRGCQSLNRSISARRRGRPNR